MFRRFVLIGVTLAVASTAAPLLSQSGEAGAPKIGCAGDAAAPDFASGEGTIAIANRELVVIGSRRDGCLYQRAALDSGLLRHVAVESGQGTAFVEDRVGDDSLRIMTPGGTFTLSGDGEVTQPSWSPSGKLAWAVDMKRVEVWDADIEKIVTIGAPQAATAIFSPVFTRAGVAAVLSEPVRGSGPDEDEVLNNLWRYDARDDSWDRVTSFTATPERWTAVRTPIVTDDGAVLFVRVSGRSDATAPPSFSLWRWRTGAATKVRDLPGEMFLAGMRGDRLMWNVYTPRCGDWELFVEGRTDLESLGCGATLVDPVNIKDPDLLVEEAERAASPETGDVPVAVVVGDFRTMRRANAVARTVGVAARVITNEDAPLAVRPDAYAVAVPVRDGTGTALLRQVRRTLPDLRNKVFLGPVEEQ